MDSCAADEQLHLEFSPFDASIPLRSPRAVSLSVKFRIERQEGSTSSARFSPVARGLTFCPMYCATRPRRQWFQATTLEYDSLHARTVFPFLKKENHQMSEHKKAIVRSLVAELLNKGNLCLAN